jgi:hypothetical protein
MTGSRITSRVSGHKNDSGVVISAAKHAQARFVLCAGFVVELVLQVWGFLPQEDITGLPPMEPAVFAFSQRNTTDFAPLSPT